MASNFHELVKAGLNSDGRGQAVCMCGLVSFATLAYPGENLVSKAKRNHAAHARRENKRDG